LCPPVVTTLGWRTKDNVSGFVSHWMLRYPYFKLNFLPDHVSNFNSV